MKTYHFDLYSILPSEDFPFEPVFQIAVKKVPVENEEGFFVLSNQLISEGDIDECVDKMIQELELIRKKAKRIRNKEIQKIRSKPRV